MIDDTQSAALNAAPKPSPLEPQDAAPEASPTALPIDPAAMIKDQAQQAILDAGGNPELLLPHITSQLGWRKDDDGVTIFSDQGEGPGMIRQLVDRLKANKGFAQAFSPVGSDDPAPPPSNKSGSGARASINNPRHGIKSSDSLALGYALRDIAAGKTKVNFNV